LYRKHGATDRMRCRKYTATLRTTRLAENEGKSTRCRNCRSRSRWVHGLVGW